MLCLERLKLWKKKEPKPTPKLTMRQELRFIREKAAAARDKKEYNAT